MNIRSERVRKGLTQEELAKAIGVSTMTYARYERNFKLAPGSAIIAMANLFECSADYLLERTTERGRAS